MTTTITPKNITDSPQDSTPQARKLKRKSVLVGAVISLVILTPAAASALNLGSISNILGSFNGVLGDVGRVLNIPGIDRVTDVIDQGREWIDRVDNFEITDIPNILNDLGLDFPGLSREQLSEILGGKDGMGVADPDASIDDILDMIDKLGKNGSSGTSTLEGEAGPAPVTPGINPAVVAPVYANNALTQSITRNSISSEGQKATQRMLKGAGTAASGTSTIAENLANAATELQNSAQSAADNTGSQTSTQDVLKTGISGLMALESANGSMLSALSQQNAAIAQLEMAQVSLGQQTRDGVHASVESLNLVNSQLNQQMQRDISEDNAAYTDLARSLRSGVRVMR